MISGPRAKNVCARKDILIVVASSPTDDDVEVIHNGMDGGRRRLRWRRTRFNEVRKEISPPPLTLDIGYKVYILVLVLSYMDMVQVHGQYIFHVSNI